MENFKSKEKKVKKRFLSKTMFNKMSDRHRYICKAFKACNIDQEKYYLSWKYQEES